jgi:RNA polymerase sigma factor (sigma-70 family)
MAGSSHEKTQPDPASSGGPDDAFLIASMLGGDPAALNKLIERYDRLVRYTVLKMSRSRCLKDPDWLDTISSDTWTGFVRSIQKKPDNPPKSVAAYLVQIARNRCTSAMRSTAPAHQSLSGGENEPAEEIAATTEDPGEMLLRIELLDGLRGCLTELDPEDRKLTAELSAITGRKWKEAAGRLGLSESTLRSRWKRVLERLRGCISRKTGEKLAREDIPSDSSSGNR